MKFIARYEETRDRYLLIEGALTKAIIWECLYRPSPCLFIAADSDFEIKEKGHARWWVNSREEAMQLAERFSASLKLKNHSLEFIDQQEF